MSKSTFLQVHFNLFIKGLLKVCHLYQQLNYDFKKNIFLKFSCLLVLFGLSSYSLQAQVSGSVYRDFNGDGTRTFNIFQLGSVEPFIPGVIVHAYNSAGVLCGVDTTSGNSSPKFHPWTKKSSNFFPAALNIVHINLILHSYCFYKTKFQINNLSKLT